MPSCGKKLSKLSKASCVPPGPPCNSKTFIFGLFPNFLVHTLNVPTGVFIGIIFTPPDCTPLSVIAWYSASVGMLVVLCVWQLPMREAMQQERINFFMGLFAFVSFQSFKWVVFNLHFTVLIGGCSEKNAHSSFCIP